MMIVVASSNKAESVAGLDEPEGDGRRSRGAFYRRTEHLLWFHGSSHFQRFIGYNNPGL
ncbi:hypothetical protein NST84_01710 [Paenibacillus sp. FSL R7-0345]|uniref:hypothetical protein n=1 Tax=Paenibacillus sp. FSL R7-0345 TaxID=2954535 RepID=UPI003159BA2C